MNVQAEVFAGSGTTHPVATLENATTSSQVNAPANRLAGKRVGMVVFSSYPFDPRPRRTIEALTQEGMTIDLLCEGEKRLPKQETRGRLEVTRIPIKHRRGGALSYTHQYVSFIAICTAVFAWRTLRKRYDLIYVHNMPDVLIICALIPKLFGAKVILDQHDPMPELMTTIFKINPESFGVRVIRYLEKWSIARADAVITVNVACKRLFAARSCSADKVSIVMNSPDETIFSHCDAQSYPIYQPDQPFVIMYHGSLVERNGLHLAIEALTQIRRLFPTVELRIYGRKTPYLEQVLETVRSVGLDSCVRYLGSKTLEELTVAIKECDLGIVPNLRNTFTDINTPTRIFEYLALGKPVIAPRTPGILDYFDSSSLLFFESGNSQELAEAIEYAVLHPNEMTALTRQAQKVSLQHSWQREKNTLVTNVAELLHSGIPH
jgi:glycosyltransferase involved in cell wall biosynthesis